MLNRLLRRIRKERTRVLRIMEILRNQASLTIIKERRKRKRRRQNLKWLGSMKR